MWYTYMYTKNYSYDCDSQTVNASYVMIILVLLRGLSVRNTQSHNTMSTVC